MTGTLPVSGPISLNTVRTTFGLTGAIALSQLYRGGAIIPNGPAQNANVPTSGEISFNDLYGATDVATPSGFTFSQTISANTQNYNVATAATAAGWNGTEPLFATITVDGAVVLGSTSTSAYAFTVPSLPANSTVTLVCDGYIVGHGGSGGTGGTAIYGSTRAQGMSAGSAGGPALLVQFPTTLKGTGVIGGGAGGGGGGEGWYGAVTVQEPSGNTVDYYAYGGGGGGAGAGSFSGASGAGGGNSRGSLPSTANYTGANGAAGGNASTTGGGAAGSPGGTANGSTAAAGGAGGALGQPGAASTLAGGAAGYAVTGTASVSYQWTGTIMGPTQ